MQLQSLTVYLPMRWISVSRVDSSRRCFCWSLTSEANRKWGRKGIKKKKKKIEDWFRSETFIIIRYYIITTKRNLWKEIFPVRRMISKQWFNKRVINHDDDEDISYIFISFILIQLY